ncbi:nucleotidyltransferase family protein [Asticcacaulis sp. AND118]|uniref:nucleotidyltransferase family protein n=1 Tax=Asticcacaulis sp. AND118 TaxID=2840468 RepID=UPI001CFF81FA|nr:nucleotidyltransferase family protein [Asticcacaulis sp. AND118]UDF05096.1 nucleotidyltransferase family protein [Asticcacaulis sp. AND118]
MLLDTLHSHKHDIETAAQTFGARRIRVFGSVARQEETPDSDIDFLVDFPEGYDLFAQRLPLAAKLSELTGRRVDLIPEHELSPHIRQHVLDEARSL